MSIYPGGKNPLLTTQYSLSDSAMANSMALAMEQEMENLFQAIKGKPLPNTGEEDRRLLFASIARGLLKYLHQQETGNITAQTNDAHTHQVHLNIDLDEF
jgi:hypothetical protein